MRVVRFFVRLVGWLLTPFVAWAASFIGALLGATVSKGVDSPGTGLIITLACGAIAGLGTLGVVIHYLRRSPRLRHALHVTEDAIPDTTEFMTEPAPPAEKQP